MKNIHRIGIPPWTRAEMIDHLDEFQSVYARRPIKDNQGGMKSPHMFATWFMAKMLSPDLIVESGIWKGQGTWLLETACPEAELVSIDLNLKRREYISSRATYSDKDFVEHDWSAISDRALVFFDDHQNAYKRLQQCKWFGFKHVIFEDNFPVSQGDCYSMKKAFANAGFIPPGSSQTASGRKLLLRILEQFKRLVHPNAPSFMPQYETVSVLPNCTDSKVLQNNLDVYFEFPPVFQVKKPECFDQWDQVTSPTPEPLLDASCKPDYEVFWEEADFYMWICYAKLK